MGMSEPEEHDGAPLPSRSATEFRLFFFGLLCLVCSEMCRDVGVLRCRSGFPGGHHERQF